MLAFVIQYQQGFIYVIYAITIIYQVKIMSKISKEEYEKALKIVKEYNGWLDVEEVKLNNGYPESNLLVIEHNGFMQLCTTDGQLLSANVFVRVTDCVDQPLSCIAKFHVKKGKIK